MWARHSDETIAIIAKCAENGMTQAETAAQLGVKRNVIVGLAFRQKIKFDGPANGGRPKMEKPPKIKPPTYMQCEAVPEPAEPSKMITFDELKVESCRFPFGERDFTFCGKNKFEDLPYCAFHARLCFQPPR